MKVENIPYGGWDNNLRITNPFIELIVTIDVGPRVLSLRTTHGENVFHVNESQLGKRNEDAFCIRGGHRLWLAPESVELSYHKDNKPVAYHEDEATGEVVVESIQATPHKVRKTLGIKLLDLGASLTIRHVVANESQEPMVAAPWALSVMREGGLAIIPQPPLGSHPTDILPNRGMVIWPYTDLSDPRWTFGQKYWLLRQAADFSATKIGLAHREKWVAYVIGDSLFVKTFEHIDGAVYPDGGCNFETFACSDFLEIESLGPLETIEPGQSVTHVERWHLFHLSEEIHIESEEALAEWISPFVERVLAQ